MESKQTRFRGYAVVLKHSPARWRRFAWAATVASLVIGALWIASGHVNLSWKSPYRQYFLIAGGRLHYLKNGMISPQPSWTFWYGYEPWSNLYRIAVWGEPKPEYVVVVFWPIPLAALVGTGWLWRRSFVLSGAAQSGSCPRCNYNRAGLAASASCPECGTLLRDGEPKQSSSL